MPQNLFCWYCNYPVTVEDTMTTQGERQTYSDTETGEIIDDCPKCGDGPLDVNWLWPEPSPIGWPARQGTERKEG